MRSCSTPGTASIADVFAVQDEITKRVVGIIGSSDAPLWRSKRQNELRERRPDSLEAYECVLPTYILTIHPRFADDPRSAFVKRRMPGELVESIMDGLRKAGPQVPAAAQ